MEKKIVTFKGISNVPDDGFNEAGDMAVLMNMRHKGGELVPCKRPTESGGYTNTKQVVYHPNSKHWLRLETSGALKYKKDNTEKDLVGEGVQSFAVMGNIVIIYFADRVEYAIWRETRDENGGASKKFVRLGELKDLFKVSFKKTAKLHKLSPEVKYYTTPNYEATDNSWFYAQGGFIDGLLRTVYQEGEFVDRVVMRVAYKLFDGTYINSSQMYLIQNDEVFTHKVNDDYTVEVGIDSDNLFSVQTRWISGSNEGEVKPGDSKEYTEGKYMVFVNSFGVEPRLESYSEDEDEYARRWRDIIQSVDVFCSASIMGRKQVERFYNNTDGEHGTRMAAVWDVKDADELVADITNCDCYKFASFNLDGVMIDRVKDTSPSALAQGDVLTVWNRHEEIARKTELYNSRLHAVNETRRLFDGYRDFSIPGENLTNKAKLAVEVTLDTEDGEKKVLMTEEDAKVSLVKVGEHLFSPALPGVLMYPDSRATQMDVFIEKGDVNKSYWMKSFILTKHDTRDMAYYVNRRYAVAGGEEVTRVAWLKGNDVKDLYVTDLSKLIQKLKEVFNDRDLVSEQDGYYAFYPSTANYIAVVKFKSNGGVSEERRLNDFNDYGRENYGIYLRPKYNYVLGEAFQQFTWAQVAFDVTTKGVSPVGYIVLDKENATTELSYDDFVGQKKSDVEALGVNTMKVSAVDNPFYFPTAQTYRFEGDIVGFASNAEAISTGQFGQYPLFVFTDTGIWTMGVDTSGQGAYATQSPFSREVCNGAICPVSGGVVFSTDKGVMVISGGQVAELSAALDGFEVDFFKENKILWGKIFQKAQKLDIVNPAPIRKYVKGAVIAYNYLYNEIIVSNKAFKYSYVYSLTSQVWSVIDTVFDLATNRYPDLVVLNTNMGKMYTFTVGDEKSDVVAITRPFTMGSLDFKRLRQAGLRTTFEGSLNFYLLGSNDGANFVCITGKEYPSKNGNEPMNVTRRDLITAMSRSKQYKYFAIAVVGNIKGRVSMAELLVDMGFANNKIR